MKSEGIKINLLSMNLRSSVYRVPAWCLRGRFDSCWGLKILSFSHDHVMLINSLFMTIKSNKMCHCLFLIICNRDKLCIKVLTEHLFNHIAGLSLWVITCNTCYGWVWFIFPGCYWWNCLLLIEFNHRVTNGGTEN